MSAAAAQLLHKLGEPFFRRCQLHADWIFFTKDSIDWFAAAFVSSQQWHQSVNSQGQDLER